MSNELQELNWSEVIDQAEEKFIEVMPDNMKFVSERSYAVQILKANDFLLKIAKNNKNSLLASMMNVASIGLSLNPAKKQAYLIPRKGVVCMDVSYMGMCDLATMSGSIKWIQARIMYQNDTFVDNGLDKAPTHTCDPFSVDRGAMIGAYCVAKTDGGDYLTTTMKLADIYAIRDKSELWKRNQSGPWKDFEEEQVKKTVVRRAFKMWPKSESLDRMALAVQVSNENEGFELLKNNPETAQYSDQQKEYFDQLITKHDAAGMFLFLQSLKESGVGDSLFNSFEKGSITKYKSIVRELEQKGGASLFDCITEIDSMALSDDRHGILQLVEDMSDDEYKYVLEQCSPEATWVLQEIIKETQEQQE